jgi:hypothetical protein
MLTFSSTNMIAPNLTLIANDFGCSTDTERDIYFGPFCSVVTTILSIPLSTIIGFSIDMLPSNFIIPINTLHELFLYIKIKFVHF